MTARGAAYASPAGWADVRLAAFHRPENLRWESRTIADVMTETGHDALDVICDLLLSEDLGVGQVTSGPWSETLRDFVTHPVGMIGTDSTFLGDKPSPRTYGSYPRVLGQFVRDEALLSLEEAIRKMTSAPAARLGLRDRGVIREGAVADLVVFDPATVRATATYDQPRSFPIGIEHVDRGRHARRRRRRPHRRDARPGLAARRRLSASIRPRRVRPSCRARDSSPRRRCPRLGACRDASPEHPLDRLRLGVHQARVGDRTRPTDGQAERDRARFEPQVAGLPDAFHVVDGGDLVGLGQQHAEATRREPRDVVRFPGVPADGVGDRHDDPVGRELAERRDEPVEPIELDHDDRDASLVAGMPSVLVGDEPVPVPQAEQAGQPVGLTARPDPARAAPDPR